MAVRIKIEPILPKKKLFDVPAGQRAKEQALKELGDEALELFEKTTDTFDHDVKFTVKENTNSVSVSTTDKIYTYLDKGTSVRYATMIPEFSPKTKVRVIGSFAGRGRVAFVDKRHPKPGIEAREFSVIIQERIQKKFAAKFKKVIATYRAGEAPGI